MRHPPALRITWVNPDRPRLAETGMTADRASVRLRYLEPASCLVAWGHDVRDVCLFDHASWARDADFYRRDVFVFGKVFGRVVPVLERMRQAGGRVVVDVCDNVFAPPEDGLMSLYDELLPHADAIVASTPELGHVIAARLAGQPPIPIHAIPDCTEGAAAPAVFHPAGLSLGLLWFGYPNNLPSLDHAFAQLAPLAAQYRVTITIVTAWTAETRRLFPSGRAGFVIRQIDWSPTALAYEMDQCDIVVIPSEAGPAQNTKTANRVITGLWSGRFVVAADIPSYREFAPFAAIGNDLLAGIRQTVADPDRTIARIERGQAHIAQHYRPAVIAARWQAALSGSLAPP